MTRWKQSFSFQQTMQKISDKIRPMREQLFARLRATIGKPGKKYIVGVSGGSDSMALLQLLYEGGWKITAVHINHHLRGKEADRDAKFVADTCEKLGIPVLIKNIALGQKGKEAEGRKKRYEIFAALLKKTGAAGVITAHHADDQAETLLLNLLRGTSLQGMKGMQPVTKLNTKKGMCTIFRPLLSTSKKELLMYCEKAKIDFREDYTNKDISFTRNFLRHEILPRLTEKNPQMVRHFAQTQQVITETVSYIEKEATKKLRKPLNERSFKKLPAILQKMILAKLLKKNLSSGRITEQLRKIKISGKL